MRANEDEVIKIQIKESAAKKAYPAIWYCAQGGKVFDAKLSKEYKGFYEIVGGYHNGKAIEKSAVDLVVAIIKNDKPGRPKITNP